jgi:hypothetical protein
LTSVVTDSIALARMILEKVARLGWRKGGERFKL